MTDVTDTFDAVARQAGPPETLLVRYVRAHVRKGEQTTERAEKAQDKSEQHFIAAGQYLRMLRLHYANNDHDWILLLKAKVGLSKNRAAELMSLADGRRDVQALRDATAERVRKHRASIAAPETAASSVTEQCNGQVTTATNSGTGSNVGRLALQPNVNLEANHLIDVLVTASSGARARAARLLIEGPRETLLEPTTIAVSDLHELLWRGRR